MRVAGQLGNIQPTQRLRQLISSRLAKAFGDFSVLFGTHANNTTSARSHLIPIDQGVWCCSEHAAGRKDAEPEELPQ